MASRLFSPIFSNNKSVRSALVNAISSSPKTVTKKSSSRKRVTNILCPEPRNLNSYAKPDNLAAEHRSKLMSEHANQVIHRPVYFLVRESLVNILQQQTES
ncbi:hypothetical protein NSMM_560016 [Nitrosomonas mobilis]|uniref:Uncharacterized protein n=1 Tax=Nitrosomonas mobilis TaxID=51642 RepID=A0A1G5SHK5_9PROT|nr:hypothetical protein NSMM_560016 [Nitrosomonas mobilis]